MNKLFDFAIIKDTVRRLKVLGITLGIILGIEAVAIPILMYLNNYDVLDGVEPAVRLYTLSDIHPFIYLIYFVFAPIFTLVIFNFLNHRNACDYFHAIPKKRSTLFVSMIVGIMIWLIILTIGSTLVSVITSLFMGSSYILSISSVITVTIGVLVASFYLVATVALAMSLTGNIFNNFVVSFMILLIPRIVITVTTAIVLGNIPIVKSSFMSIPFIDSSYNIYFATYTTVFGIDETPFSLKSIIYTLILGFVYLIIALFVFKKRKSESAGLAAPTPALQAVFRILLCLVICLAPIYILANTVLFENYYSPTTLFLIIILYIVAIVAYFVYEIIATKSLKTFARAAKGLIFVAIANALILIFMYVGYSSILNYQPTKDEIKYVSIDFSESLLYGNYLQSGDNSYFLENTTNYKITNDKIKEIVSDTLRDNCEYIKEYRYINYGDYTLAVNINSGGLTKQRLLNLGDKDIKTIIDCLAEDEDYISTIKYMPEYDSIKDISYIDINSSYSLTRDQVKEIYNMLYDHYNSLSHKELLKNAIFKTNEKQTIYATLYFSINDGIKESTASIPISSDVPEIAQKYFSFVVKNEKKDISELLDVLNNDVLSPEGYKDVKLNIASIDDDENDIISISMQKTFNDFVYNPLNISRDYSDEEMQTIISIINSARNNKFDENMHLIEIYYTYYDNLSGESGSTNTIMLPLTNSQYTTLLQMTNERDPFFNN